MEEDEMEKRQLEVQEDIYMMDDSVLKIREIKIVKALKVQQMGKALETAMLWTHTYQCSHAILHTPSTKHPQQKHRVPKIYG